MLGALRPATLGLALLGLQGCCGLPLEITPDLESPLGQWALRRSGGDHERTEHGMRLKVDGGVLESWEDGAVHPGVPVDLPGEFEVFSSVKQELDDGSASWLVSGATRADLVDTVTHFEASATARAFVRGNEAQIKGQMRAAQKASPFNANPDLPDEGVYVERYWQHADGRRMHLIVGAEGGRTQAWVIAQAPSGS